MGSQTLISGSQPGCFSPSTHLDVLEGQVLRGRAPVHAEARPPATSNHSCEKCHHRLHLQVSCVAASAGRQALHERALSRGFEGGPEARVPAVQCVGSAWKRPISSCQPTAPVQSTHALTQ